MTSTSVELPLKNKLKTVDLYNLALEALFMALMRSLEKLISKAQQVSLGRIPLAIVEVQRYLLEAVL